VSQPTHRLERSKGEGPPLRNVPDYRQAAQTLPREQTVVPPLGTSPLRQLSMVERATVKVTPFPFADVPLGNSTAHEATFRLALAAHQGWLPYASGFSIARYFETVFWGSHPSPKAQRGWDLLERLDRLGFAEVWLSAEPLLTAPNRFRQMRLHERADEIRGSLTGCLAM